MTDVCGHPDAGALEVSRCGDPELWTCETLGGCGETYTVIRPHHVLRIARHADGCGDTKMPADWCGCEYTLHSVCMDCPREFPLEVTDDLGPNEFVEVHD